MIRRSVFRLLEPFREFIGGGVGKNRQNRPKSSNSRYQFFRRITSVMVTPIGNIFVPLHSGGEVLKISPSPK